MFAVAGEQQPNCAPVGNVSQSAVGESSGADVKSTLLAGVGLVALTVGTSGAAQAADAAVPTLPAWSWSGFYLGAHAGYAWARDPFDDPIFGGKFPSGPNDLTGINSRGGLAGFQAGANWQKGAWVGGLEIDLSGTWISGTTSIANATTAPGIGTLTGTASLRDKFDMIGSGRVRLGYLPWPNVLVYGTGGLAWARLDQTLFETATIPGLAVIDSSSTPTWRFGWVAGVGAETRLWNTNWLARLEYLHYDFADSGSSSSVLTTNGVTGSTISTSGPLTVDVVRAGFSYQFGMMPSAGTASAYPGQIFAKAPPQATAPWNWAGLYIGAHGGYGWGHDPFSELDSVGAASVTLSGIDSSGALGGFQAGANWQKDRWVGGLEIDLSAASISGAHSISGSTPGPGTLATGTLTERDQFRLLGSARARVGYLVWPTTLLYGTAGLAWTHQDATSVDTETSTSPGFNSASTDTSSTPNWRFGWVAGVGAEKRIADTNLIGRVEYLHYDFGGLGSDFSSSTVAGVTTISTNFSSGHITADVVRAGVSYKFGGDVGALAPVLVTKAPASAPASWSGFYIGGHGGYGWGHDPSVQDEIPFNTADVILTDINSNGWVGGFQAGANWQRDRWVVGGELDLSATGLKGTASGTATLGTATNSALQTDQFDLLASGRARAGFLPMPNLLVYGTGGLAWTRFSQMFALTESTPGSVFISTSTSTVSRWGWVAGFGAETKIGHSNWLGRIEYLHYDFGTSGNGSETFAGGGFSQTSADTTGRLTADVVRAGISYLLP